jgi:hypothetical protein
LLHHFELLAKDTMADEEGTGGTLADSADIIAQYQTTRIRAFWTGYKRCNLIQHLKTCVNLNEFLSITESFN